MRRYGEDIEVRAGLVAGDEGPAQFLWRGRVWLVRALLSSWVTSTPWWRGVDAARVLGCEEGWAQSEELQVWRVEAGRGGGHRSGVFDISRSSVTGQWRLETCLD